MIGSFSENELFNACRILFGPEIEVSHGFLHYIQHSGIKQAYYKKAKFFHPDVNNNAGIRGESCFRNVNNAFCILKKFIEARDRIHAFTENQHISTSYPNSRDSHPRDSHPRDHFYNGPLPRKTLRFGQFLYYSGIISWNLLIKAIIWQRKHRVSLGKLAVKAGLLKHQDILVILENKKSLDFFGDIAVKLGFLKPGDIRYLLQKQRSYGFKIGNYFILNKHISEGKLYRYLAQHKKHNYNTTSTPIW